MEVFSSEIKQKLQGILARKNELSELLVAPEIAADSKLLRKLEKEYNSFKTIAEKYLEYLLLDERVEYYNQSLEVCDDEEAREIMQLEIADCASGAEKLAIDIKNELAKAPTTTKSEVLLEIKNFNGAPDCDKFVNQLSCIYSAFCDKEGFEFSVTKKDNNCANFVICGRGAIEKLVGESGLHTAIGCGENAGKSPQIAIVIVIENLTANLSQINEKDIRIDLFHSSGAGGQNVNKVETAVRITHLPTGVVVCCQDERSQLKNKRRALETLQNKINDTFVQENESKMRKAKKEIIALAQNKKVRNYNFDKKIVSDCNLEMSESLDKVLGGDLSSFICLL
ncbi:MAG: peptide chain release factor-like protein [Clostridia bacterium]